MTKILIITSSYDLTADYIIKKYKEIDFFRFNSDQFSQYEAIVDHQGFSLKSKYHSITELECSGIYYRKPSLENLNSKMPPEYQIFCHKEVLGFIEGIVESFEGQCLSKPSTMRRANNKILQLKLAKEIGFKIPNSKITNSKDLLHKFNQKEIIIKPLATGTIHHEGTKEIIQTNLVDSSISIESLKYTPSYFQHYIEKDYELRTTIVNHTILTVRIDSKNKIDWRKKDNVINYKIAQLPKEIEKKCLDFMSQLEIKFGCFDFIVRSGEYYFLEMNANGQWAWLEMETGTEISKAIVEYLSYAQPDL